MASVNAVRCKHNSNLDEIKRNKCSAELASIPLYVLHISCERQQWDIRGAVMKELW